MIPCTMKTLGGIASGYSDNTILRAAEVTLKERRRLVVVARETPLSVVDTENMLKVSRAGAIILPPVLPFYNRPKRLETVIDHLVGKVLDMFDIEHGLYHRWMGFEAHAEYHGLEIHRVKDVMTPNVLVTTPDATVMDAAKLMAAEDRGSISSWITGVRWQLSPRETSSRGWSRLVACRRTCASGTSCPPQ